jgi:hypothetical protein
VIIELTVIHIPYLTGLRYLIVRGTSAKLIRSIKPLKRKDSKILILIFFVLLSAPKYDFNLINTPAIGELGEI